MDTETSGPADLRGQTAVVTGGNGDIGGATCETLARAGADVVAVDVDLQGIEERRQRVEAHGRTFRAVECDVGDPDDVDRLARRVDEEHDAVDILVFAHGVVDRTSVPDLTPDRWQETMDHNLTGTFLVTQAFLGGMVARGYGKVVVVGSSAVRSGGISAGASYSAAKGGQHVFAKTLAGERASDGVFVNVVAPGPVRTEMQDDDTAASSVPVPLGRIGHPTDVAEAVLFLASQQSNWITGEVLDLNGGLDMS